MGRSVTPKYRVEYWTNNKPSKQTMIWDVKSRANVTGLGAPSTENLEKWRKTYNFSFKDGVNKHVSEAAGYIVHIGRCRIVDQFTGRVAAEFVPPMFEVV